MKQWLHPAERFDSDGTVGKFLSEDEMQASQGTRMLTYKGNPPPQTIYTVELPPGSPFLIQHELSL